MNTYLLKEATKLAVMTASIDDPNLEDTDALTELDEAILRREKKRN